LNLGRLLSPASIAVVGATERRGSYAAQCLLNLDAIGFAGAVWGVNPRYEVVHGRPCVASLAELSEPVDAVVVAIPAEGVVEVVEAAGALGCGGAVVIGAGFGEIAGGRERQAALAASARRHQLPVCGPNCNGIVAMASRAALWGDALSPREVGRVALVSQSGNVAVNALAAQRGLRFHTVVSSGNQAVLSAGDYLAHLAADDGVGAVALYLEDDGDAGALCDALAACVESRTPVVVLKVGASAAGASAAATHTGALAGDQRVFRALVEEAGGVWADDVHDLLELAKTLSVTRPVPASGGLAILTCSGGDSSQGADEAAALGLPLPALAESTAAVLAPLLPESATVGNPLDYTATIWGDVEALGEIVRAVGDDPGVEQVLIFYDQLPGLEGAVEESWRAVREGIARGAALSPVPTLVSSTLPELLDDAAAWVFAQAGVAAVAGLRSGLRAARATRTSGVVDPASLRAIGRAASGGAPGAWIAEHEAKALVAERGVAVVPGRLVADAADAVAALAELGGAVAAKVSSSAIQHKAQAGALELDLRSADAVIAAHERLAAVAARSGGAVLVEAMAAPGVELIVAARRDGIVPALMLGLGGALAELLDDVAIVPLPASDARIERALRDLRGARVLARVDLAAVVGVARALAGALLELDLDLIELNPVIAGEAGAVAVDAVVRRRASAEDPLETGRGRETGLDRAVDEAGPAVRQVGAGE
jgi:acetyl-CoA synthetase